MTALAAHHAAQVGETTNLWLVLLIAMLVGCVFLGFFLGRASRADELKALHTRAVRAERREADLRAAANRADPVPAVTRLAAAAGPGRARLNRHGGVTAAPHPRLPSGDPA